MFGLSDSALTAWATVALAFVGAVGILTGVAVTIATRNAAAAARKATELQAREIGLLETQTKLLKDQQEEARSSAFPWLQATFADVGDLYIEGNIQYVAGSAPAWATKVWVRTSHGYFLAAVGFVAPGASRQFRAVLHTDEDQFDCPFDEFKKLIGDEIGWIGVTWEGPGYWVGGQRWRMLEESRRYVGERMSRWFDEDAALEDHWREEAERGREREAIDTLVPPNTDHRLSLMARLLRRGRGRRVKP